MRAVHKFPLSFSGDLCNRVALPTGAQMVLVGAQGGTPTLWALVDSEAELETRRFQVIGTGWAVQPGAQHLGSYQDGPFVWHVFELGDDMPADLPAEAYPHYRVLVRDGFTLRADRAWLAPHDVPAGHMTTEQMVAVATLQEHGYGSVVDA